MSEFFSSTLPAKKRIVLLGPPVSGKGTQAELISGRFGVPAISSGAMFREEACRGTELGRAAEEYTRFGRLIPDEIVIAVLEKWLAGHPDAFLLDGFPRTLPQCEALETLLAAENRALDAAFFLNISFETLKQRVVNRVTCTRCGRIFAVESHQEAADETCSVCGSELTRRRDDTLEILEARLAEYREKTEPVVAFYQQRGLLYEIPAADRPETVFAEISAILSA